MKPILASLVGIWLSQPSYGHEGHGIPGALPAAPHGGVVQEAEHKEKDVHEGKEETELFFEAVYKGTDLKVYPLGLAPGNTAKYIVVSPDKDLSKVAIKVELPRAKKTETLKFTVAGDAFQSTFDAKGANRFIVHVAAEHGKEPKAAKIQIETN